MSLLTTLRPPHDHKRVGDPAALALVLALVALGGCSRSQDAPTLPKLATNALAAPENGPRFLAPPQPVSATRRADGEVEIAGRAPPNAVVSLRNPDGQTVDIATAPDGGWVARLPANASPRLYALTATLEGRVLRGEGAIVQAPAPAPAAFMLRAGAASIAFGDANGALALDVFDFDGAGGLAIAGRAPPKSALRLTLDGRPAVAGQADDKGRFALMAVQGDLKPGKHTLRLEGAGRALDVVIDATPSPPPPGTPYAVRQLAGGWRVDWATPGGGSQSSVLFALGASGAGA